MPVYTYLRLFFPDDLKIEEILAVTIGFFFIKTIPKSRLFIGRRDLLYVFVFFKIIIINIEVNIYLA